VSSYRVSFLKAPQGLIAPTDVLRRLCNEAGTAVSMPNRLQVRSQSVVVQTSVTTLTALLWWLCNEAGTTV